VLAVANNHYELGAFLLDRGADPNAAAQGWTALHQITWMRKPGQGSNRPGPAGSGNLDSLEFVKRLAARGANLNARMTRRAQVGTTDFNMIGATPLLMAARTADAPLMRLLADLGADPRLTNEDGTTLLMAAAGVGVHSPGEDPGSETEALEAVKLAIALGNDINTVDKTGNTAMHGAAYKQFPTVVDFLVERGASIDVWNRKNKQGWTPLRIAVGVHRGMNFRFSKPTAAALERIMKAAGVSTVVEPEAVISGATK
jgi:ankyrin repeat protein